MRAFRDHLEVTRGESFTYDVLLENKDGSPLLISNQLQNPYLLLTIASTKYAMYGRYLHNFWSNLKFARPTNTKVFYTPNWSVVYQPPYGNDRYINVAQIDKESAKLLPAKVGDYILGKDGNYGIITSITEGLQPLLHYVYADTYGKAVSYNDNYIEPNRFYTTKAIAVDSDMILDNISPYDGLGVDIQQELLSLIKSNKISIDTDDYAVYYTIDTDKYYYWTGLEYKEYKNEFSISFTSDVTLKWVEQEYDIGLKVVDGQKSGKSSNDRMLTNFSFMNKINIPSQIIVASNISGSMEETDYE